MATANGKVLSKSSDDLTVGNGATASGLRVRGEATLTVAAGGTVTGTAISRGGVEVVQAGGLSVDTLVQDGGTLRLSGAEPGDSLLAGRTRIFEGGRLEAAGLGIASGASFWQAGGVSTVGDMVDDGAVQFQFGVLGASSLTIGTQSKGSFVQNGGSVTVDGTVAVSRGSSGSYVLSSGVLSATALTVGVGGRFAQSGGTASFAEVVAIDGLATVASGIFNARDLDVGGTGKGRFTQVGGTVALGNALSVAGDSVYTHGSGILTAASLSVAAHGNFTQDGGSATFTGTLVDSGTVRVGNGILHAAGLDIGAGGGYAQSGGSALFDGAVVNRGAMTIGSGIFEASSLDVGPAGKATVVQGGGTATVDGALAVGAGSVYTLTSGILSAESLSIETAGRFAQNGGTVSVSGEVDADGLLTVSNGIFGAGSLDLGRNGKATIRQNGGTARIEGALEIEGGSTYDHGSGILDAGSLSIADGARFMQAGGTTSIVGDVTNDQSISLAGGAFYVAGDILGAGSIVLGAALLEVDGVVSATQSLAFAANAASLLDLGDADSFHGTVAGLSADDSIALRDFGFGSTTITDVSGTGAARSYTSVTLSDGSQSATFALYNQYAGQFAVTSSAYALRSETDSATPGTLFGLASPVA